MRRFQLTHILAILADLQKKMVLLAGPRQAGKTWLSKEIAKHYQRPIYLNYDNFNDRSIIAKQKLAGIFCIICCRFL